MDDLITAAKHVREQAYAPYSHFLVGCAIRGATGGIHIGCNVENAAYPLTACAEANAIGAMIAAGEHQISEIVIVGNGSTPCSPCGGCRQRIHEFARDDVKIHMLGADGGMMTLSLGELLPVSFGPDALKGSLA